MKNRVVLTLALVSALSSAALAAEGTSKPAKNKRTQQSETQTVVVAGRKVAIDPKTGKLRQPTPAESRALAAGLKNMLNRSTEGLTVRERPNGTKAVDLEGRFQSATVAVRNADGSVTTKCVHGEDKAEAAIRNDAGTSNKTAEVK